MPDTKISAGADPTTLVSTDKVPIARSASTTAYAATMAEVATWTNTQLPLATTTPLMDGTGAAGSATTVSRSDHRHPTDTTLAPLASPPLTGTPTAPTVTPATDSTTKLATTAFVQSAMAVNVAVNNTNYIDNSGFTINQRGYTSGTALAAAAFGFDRWKAGASGCTLTFTAAPASTVVTITAGSLQQVIEGVGLITGTYTLSWTGSAQARIGGGSYAASPINTVSATAGTNLTIEFNTGTVSRVKLEIGATATTWQPEPPQRELARCQRFFVAGQCVIYGYGVGGAGAGQTYALPTSMRASAIVTPTTSANTNVGTVSLTALGNSLNQIWVNATVTVTGGWQINQSFTASADL